MAEKKARAAGNAVFSPESIKMIAESVGIGNLHEDSQQYLADAVMYQLKAIAQDAKKCLDHGKRKRLSTGDLDRSIRLIGYEPIYGIHVKDHVPFRHAIGGGREIHYMEEKETDLQDILNAAIVKVPYEATLKSHWLSIDGEQPTVPDNPPPISKDVQQMEVLDPSVKAATSKPKNKSASGIGKGKSSLKIPEKVRLKETMSHELCIEQQHYFSEITDACVGSEEARRNEALTSLSMDPGLSQMVPRLCSFISEGIRVNISLNNLLILIQITRMTKALMENPSVYLEKCLHLVVPSLLSCIVSKRLCQRPDTENHWALRNFASSLIGQLCRAYSNSTNHLQERITTMLNDILLNEKSPLSTRYGAIITFSEIGPEAVRTFVLPLARNEVDRVAAILDNSLGSSIGACTATDRVEAEHIREALIKVLPPVLKSVRSVPDNLDEYQKDYGCLGAAMHAAVVKARKAPAGPMSSTSMPMQKPMVQLMQSKLPSMVLPGSSAQPLQQIRSVTPRFPVGLGGQLSGSSSHRVMYVAPQRTSVPLFQPSQINPQTAVIRVVSSGTATPGTPTVSGPAQKIVVMTPTPGPQVRTVPDLGMRSIFGSAGLAQSTSSISQDTTLNSDEGQ